MASFSDHFDMYSKPYIEYVKMYKIQEFQIYADIVIDFLNSII